LTFCLMFSLPPRWLLLNFVGLCLLSGEVLFSIYAYHPYLSSEKSPVNPSIYSIYSMSDTMDCGCFTPRRRVLTVPLLHITRSRPGRGGKDVYASIQVRSCKGIRVEPIVGRFESRPEKLRQSAFQSLPFDPLFIPP